MSETSSRIPTPIPVSPSAISSEGVVWGLQERESPLGSELVHGLQSGLVEFDQPTKVDSDS